MLTQKWSSNRACGIILKGFLRLTGFCRMLFVRLQVKRVGRGTRCCGSLILSGGRNVSIGKNCYFGRSVVVDATAGPVVIGDGVEIRDEVRIYAGEIRIGSGVTLGEGTHLNGRIDIKDGAWISRGCDLSGKVVVEGAVLGPQVSCIGGLDHARDDKTGRLLMANPPGILGAAVAEEAAIHIGANAWIGQRAIILKGVTVEAEAIVGAGSVVTKTVPPRSMAVGNPARVIKVRDV